MVRAAGHLDHPWEPAAYLTTNQMPLLFMGYGFRDGFRVECAAMQKLLTFIAGLGWFSFYLFLIVIALGVALHFPAISYWWPGYVNESIKILLCACPASILSALITVTLMRRSVKP